MNSNLDTLLDSQAQATPTTKQGQLSMLRHRQYKVIMQGHIYNSLQDTFGSIAEVISNNFAQISTPRTSSSTA